MNGSVRVPAEKSGGEDQIRGTVVTSFARPFPLPDISQGVAESVLIQHLASTVVMLTCRWRSFSLSLFSRFPLPGPTGKHLPNSADLPRVVAAGGGSPHNRPACELEPHWHHQLQSLFEHPSALKLIGPVLKWVAEHASHPFCDRGAAKSGALGIAVNRRVDCSCRDLTAPGQEAWRSNTPAHRTRHGAGDPR